METEELKIKFISQKSKNDLKKNDSYGEERISSAKQRLKDNEFNKSSSIISFLTPQSQMKEVELNEISIDEQLKKNLKMRSSILRNFTTSPKQEVDLPKNSSLSFGALYSYLFEN